MNTNKILIFSVVIVAALAFLAGSWYKGSSLETSEPTTSVSPSPTATPAPSVGTTQRPRVTPVASTKPVTHIVRFTQQGPQPKSVTIRAGDTVSFINATDAQFWPASDPHPSHTLCAGFDAKRGLRLGDGYTLTFTTRKTCTYHNHLDPFNDAFKGTIIVQ